MENKKSEVQEPRVWVDSTFTHIQQGKKLMKAQIIEKYYKEHESVCAGL